MNGSDRPALTAAPPASAAPPPLDKLWDHFYTFCFNIINQCPGVRKLSPADREDCVQDVMMEIVRKLGAERPEGVPEQLIGWIRVISRNKAADIIRRRSRKPTVSFGDGSGATLLDHASDNADLNESTAEYVAVVWEALLALDQKVSATSYLVFYLHNIEGWSNQEVADLFQMTPEQVRARAHRARAKFSDILKSGQKQPGPGVGSILP